MSSYICDAIDTVDDRIGALRASIIIGCGVVTTVALTALWEGGLLTPLNPYFWIERVVTWLYSPSPPEKREPPIDENASSTETGGEKSLEAEMLEYLLEWTKKGSNSQ